MLSSPVVLLRRVAAPVAVLLFPVLKSERASADTSVEGAVGQGVERKQTNRCVELAFSEIKKGVLPRTRVAAGKVILRVRDDRLRSG